MTHPLQKTIQSVRKRARRLVLAYGISRVLSIAVVTGLLLALADFAIRIEDRGVRVIWSVIALATCLWAIQRFLLQPLRRRRGDVEIAQRIERCFPQMQDRLSCAIEFLAQSETDTLAGSAELRRSVIHQVSSDLDPLDLSAVFDRRPTRRAVGLALAAGLGLLALIAWQPQLARVAAARLFNPLGSASWPKQHHLAFVDPPRQLALGQAFEVELIDEAGELPPSARMHYRYRVGDEVTEEIVPLQSGSGNMRARKENVSRPFEYRAEGGDDNSMEWIALEVVEPPRVQDFTVTLHPPAYTGFPAAPSEKRIRALRGTRIELAGTSTKPLRSAKLKFISGETFAAEIDAGGFGFAFRDPKLLVDQSGVYSFELVDQENLTGGAETQWDIRAVTDSPPSVSIEQPATNVFVTPEAVVPVRVLAKDNLRIASVALEYMRSDRTDQQAERIELFQGPEQATAAATDQPQGSLDTGESRVVDYRWELNALGLKPGMSLALTAIASDYLPQTGQSPITRRITIISPTELEDRLAQRQGVILAELGRALQMQREARGQVSRLEIQQQEVGRLEKTQLDALQAAELNQRQVQRTLTSREEGIVGQIESMLGDLASNQVDSPEIHRRMQTFLDEIARLDKQQLPTVRKELTAALKSAQANDTDQPASPLDPVGKSLTTAGAQQDEVIGTLERLRGELSEWADYRRFARDVRQLQQDQQDLQQRTATTGQQTLSTDQQQLTRQQAADLKKLSQEQLELSRRFDKIAQGMEQAGESLSEKDPLAASTLDDALHQLRRDGISSQMRESARDIEQNRMFGANDQQQAVSSKLNELLDILSNRKEQELGRLVKKLQQAEKDLAALRAEQQGLRKKQADAEKIADPAERQRELEKLSKKSKQLAEDITRLARHLQRLQAEQAARSMQRGAESLGRAEESSGQGDSAGAEEHAEQAEQDLADAQQELAEARKKAEQDLAEEMLARFEDTLKGLIARQQHMLGETERLETARNSAGELAPEQADSVQVLSREQITLAEETTGHGTKLGERSAFSLALEGVAKAMQRAARLLSGGETGNKVQEQERIALERLTRMMKAFAEDKNEEEQNSEKQGGEGEGEGGGQGQGIPDIAELKLLKLLQEGVSERTAQLAEEIKAAGETSAEQEQEFADLRAEQGRLADLVFSLIETESATDQDSPENLPDLRKELEPGAERPKLEVPKIEGLEDDLPKLDLPQDQ